MANIIVPRGPGSSILATRRKGKKRLDKRKGIGVYVKGVGREDEVELCWAPGARNTTGVQESGFEQGGTLSAITDEEEGIHPSKKSRGKGREKKGSEERWYLGGCARLN